MNTRFRSFFWGLPMLALALLLGAPAGAAVVATGFFQGTVERYDPQTGESSTLATLPGAQLSGVTFDANTNRLYVSALNQGGVYSLDATTGSVLGFAQLGIGPGGLTVGPGGDIYVANFGANRVEVYDADFNAKSPIELTGVPAPPSGVGFTADGELIISTAGAGVYRYDGQDVTPFSSQTGATAQVAVDATGNVYVGHGTGGLNHVYKFDASGNEIPAPGSDQPFLTITPEMIDSAGGSSPGTSPGGVAIDEDGNLIVAVLGQGNPADPEGERGGLFKLTPEGELIKFGGSIAYSSVTVVPAVIPEPSSWGLLAVATVAGAVLIRRRRGR